MNIMMLLEMAASGFPERKAVRNGDAELTYGELFEASRRAAAYARARVSSGSHCST
jgi:non-ribosomal peptide synthetase component F